MICYLKSPLRKVGKGILFILVITMLSSCSDVGKENRRSLMQLKLGMNREQVMIIMGRPHHNAAKQIEKGVSREILYYETATVIPSAQLTALVFENGKLVSWGKRSHHSEEHP